MRGSLAAPGRRAALTDARRQLLRPKVGLRTNAGRGAQSDPWALAADRGAARRLALELLADDEPG
ncbi:MAG: hypothetical protein JWP75_2109, partial [Frondihabitans sp.]|nr:hypothetical protein [Frondihabitans sp.]